MQTEKPLWTAAAVCLLLLLLLATAVQDDGPGKCLRGVLAYVRRSGYCVGH